MIHVMLVLYYFYKYGTADGLVAYNMDLKPKYTLMYLPIESNEYLQIYEYYYMEYIVILMYKVSRKE